jgi:hypothetical protein
MSSKDWRPTAFVETTPGVVGENEADAGRSGQRRSLLAFVLRLISLDTVALVLVVALIEKAFAQPQRREWVAVAVVAFVLSAAVGGMSALLLNAGVLRAGAGRQPDDPRRWLAAAGATFLAFIVGIAALAGFFLANWLR